MESNTNQRLNPWLDIWTKPRATIQQIVDTDPDRLVVLLAAVNGVAQLLNHASTRNLGDRVEWPVIFAIAAIIGPIVGVISLYIGGILLGWTGKWIGGVASPRYIRSAIAWSSVPVIWSMPLWIPELALFGQELFTSDTPKLDADHSLRVMLLFFASIEVTVGVWSGIIFLKCLGQVQGFSAWKALANALLAGLVVIVPILLIAFAAAALLR